MSAFSININAAAIGSESINTVNARDLHAFLGVGRDFSSWIKSRIEVYGFAENVDYVTAENLVRQNGGIKKHGDAGRTLRYQGRVVKPELRKCIRALIKQLQPELIGLE